MHDAVACFPSWSLSCTRAHALSDTVWHPFATFSQSNAAACAPSTARDPRGMHCTGVTRPCLRCARSSSSFQQVRAVRVHAEPGYSATCLCVCVCVRVCVCVVMVQGHFNSVNSRVAHTGMACDDSTSSICHRQRRGKRVSREGGESNARSGSHFTLQGVRHMMCRHMICLAHAKFTLSFQDTDTHRHRYTHSLTHRHTQIHTDTHTDTHPLALTLAAEQTGRSSAVAGRLARGKQPKQTKG